MPSQAQAEPTPRAAAPEPPSPASRQATGATQQEGVACCRRYWLAPRHGGHVPVFSSRAYLKAAARPLPLPHHTSLAQKFPSLGCLLALSLLTSALRLPSPHRPRASSLPSQRSAAQLGAHGRVSRVPVLGSDFSFSALGFFLFYFLLVLCEIVTGLGIPMEGFGSIRRGTAIDRAAVDSGAGVVGGNRILIT
jgi:hypothetical protein